jgi:hypothetical protein
VVPSGDRQQTQTWVALPDMHDKADPQHAIRRRAGDADAPQRAILGCPACGAHVTLWFLTIITSAPVVALSAPRLRFRPEKTALRRHRCGNKRPIIFEIDNIALCREQILGELAAMVIGAPESAAWDPRNG